MCEPWQLTPEGAAIHPDEQTAVIADVHLGYEWARGAAGDCVPAHSLAETIGRLGRLLDRGPITRLVVAGDLVESSRPCPRTTDDLRRLRDWLGLRGVKLFVLEGNHDRARARTRGRLPHRKSHATATCTIAGWTVGHGHFPLAGARTISGHLHPVLRVAGTRAPCFLAGAGRIILPAFSANAAGWDVATGRIPREWLASALRCFVSTGLGLLDFGPLPELRRRLRGVAT
jgi:putative SbcD/Mre11-related phosphoesterase